MMPQFRALIEEMQRLHASKLAADEHFGLPPSITQGNGILVLLEHRYGRAGYAETQTKLGLTDDIISYLQNILDDAATNIGMTEDDLRKMYEPATARPV